MERFLITGALGCLGAWVVRNLIQDGAEAVIYDVGSNRDRLKLVLDDPDAVIYAKSGDVTDLEGLKQAAEGATHIIHLAALQIPFCRENPALGARVNVVGTVNVFEAAQTAGIRRVVYASSVGVYGPPDDYASERVTEADSPAPRTHYGVFKQANEGTARIYHSDNGVRSIGLRPYIIYGPGRDQGMTSSPTAAMLAAVKGDGYHIPFGGTAGYQFVDDVARTFIQAARSDFDGAGVFNLRGQVVHMREMVEAIKTAVPGARITYDDNPLPFPAGMDDAALRQAIGEVPNTSLADGVAATVAHFRSALA